MKYHFVDTLIPFRRKNRVIDNLNMRQFLSQRYGIGDSVAQLLCRYSGYSFNLKSNKITRSYVSERLRKFFVNHVEFLDKNLREHAYNGIMNHIKLRTYKGFRHTMKYPTNGQRTRSNAKTRKRFFVK